MAETLKQINLEFEPLSMPSLSGDAKGEAVFKKQVEPKLLESDYQNGFIIKFPDHISIIGASFLQGFVREMVRKIGYDGIVNRVRFETSDEELTKEVYDDIL